MSESDMREESDNANLAPDSDVDTESSAEAPPTMEELKNQGNAAFKAGDAKEAIRWWTKAIEVDTENTVALYTNRAMAYNKPNVARFGDAVADCMKALEISPGLAKAYLRLGRAKWMVCDFDGAIAAYTEVLSKEKQNEDARADLAGVKNDVQSIARASDCLASKNYAAAKMHINRVLAHCCVPSRDITMMKARCIIYTEPEIAARDLRVLLQSSPHVCNAGPHS